MHLCPDLPQTFTAILPFCRAGMPDGSLTLHMCYQLNAALLRQGQCLCAACLQAGMNTPVMHVSVRVTEMR